MISTPSKWINRLLYTAAFLYSSMCLFNAGVDHSLGQANWLTYTGMVTHTIFMAFIICASVDAFDAWKEKRKMRRQQRELRRRPVRLRLVEERAEDHG